MAEPKSKNLTWHEGQVSREDREKKLGQKGCTIWLTGLSGSGKSTLAVAAEKLLADRGHLGGRGGRGAAPGRLELEPLQQRVGLQLPAVLDRPGAAVPLAACARVAGGVGQNEVPASAAYPKTHLPLDY